MNKNIMLIATIIGSLSSLCCAMQPSVLEQMRRQEELGRQQAQRNMAEQAQRIQQEQQRQQQLQRNFEEQQRQRAEWQRMYGPK